jgi:GNAT superfamily N-acetyltransferase
MKNIDFMLIHSDYIDNVPVETFESKKLYFRMKHPIKDVEKSQIPEGFSIIDVDPETEADKVSSFIGECYENMHPSTETVESWTEKSVFDDESWIWIKDDEKDKKAALGIAEFDERISEISLEWIQVHPEFRAKGIGRVLVNVLLDRAEEKANFATVGGEYGSDSSPKSFYERCGFEGDDIWFVLRK